MDWYLDACDHAAASALRRELRAHLEAQAGPGSDVDAAEVVISELLTNAGKHAGGPAWITLDWRGSAPILTVRDVGPGFALQVELPENVLSEGGRGLYLVAHLALDLDVARRKTGGAEVCAVLPVRRLAGGTRLRTG